MKDKKFLHFLTDTTSGMAKGLFATLIIGTIISTIAKFIPDDTFIYSALYSLSNVLKMMTGAGIGIGIALSLKQDGLKLVSLGISGQIASFMAGSWSRSDGKFSYDFLTFGFKIGDPLTVYFVVVLTAVLMILILKKATAVDIILIPLFAICVSAVLTVLLSYPIAFITQVFGAFINEMTNAHPFVFGILISILMGMALTAPISSAAIAVAFSINGLAGGAAVCGCCVQMLGFAIQSIKDNKIGTVISVGIGTSMLQFKNIVKKPIVWLPTIIASAILGPITTCIFKTTCTPAGAGMGTSGLVGIFGVLDSMESSGNVILLNIILGLIVLPISLVFIIDKLFRHFNIIKNGDLTI